MAFDYIVVILDPRTGHPLRRVDVEAYAESDGDSMSVVSTNDQGFAEFTGLAERARFRARMGGDVPIYQVLHLGGSGSGPFGFDYLVDANWATEVTAGRGTEGQSFTTFHGHTFNVYSTIGGAVTAANTLNTTGKMFSIAVVPGTYTESITWPNSTDGNTYSGLLIVGLGTSDDHEDFGQVLWKPTSGSAIELNKTNPIGMQLENLVLAGQSGQPAIDWSAGINLKGHAINCEFLDDVEMNTAGFWFQHCRFTSSGCTFKGEDSDDLYFIDCFFNGLNGGIDLTGDPANGVTIVDCDFTNGSTITLGRGSDIQIRGNTFSVASGNANDAILLDNSTENAILHNVTIVGNTFEYRPVNNGSLIPLN